MSHDVFISHSSKDKTVADAVCSTLESEGIRCWIAPRDIRAGDSWGSSIIKGIESSSIMLIIFSENSNASQQVMREVERAVQKNVVVVPFRIDGVQPSADMEYFLSATHWLDAMTPELDAHLDQLTVTIRSILDPEESEPPATPAAPTRPVAAPPPAAPIPPSPAPATKKSPTLLLGIVAVVAIAIIAFLLLKPDSSTEEPAPPPVVVNQATQPPPPQNQVAAETVATPSPQEPTPVVNNVATSESVAQRSETLPTTPPVVANDPPPSVPTEQPVIASNTITQEKPAVVAPETVAPPASVPISSSPPAEITVAVPAQATAGSSIDIAWTGPALRGDYVSVAKPSSRAGRQHNRYQYVRTGQPASLRMPEESGTYEIRYISGGSDAIGASTSIEVTLPEIIIQEIGEVVAGSNFNVTFSGGGFSGDFIAIFKPGDTISRYSTNKYTSRGNTINFRAPNEPGTYVLRYLSGQEKREWATREFTVRAKE